MEQSRRGLIAFLLGLIIFCSNNVYATAPDKITLDRVEEWYCLERAKKIPSNDMEMKLEKELDAGYAYIFALDMSQYSTVSSCYNTDLSKLPERSYDSWIKENESEVEFYDPSKDPNFKDNCYASNFAGKQVKMEAIWGYATATNTGNGGLRGSLQAADKIVKDALAMRKMYDPYVLNVTDKNSKVTLSSDSKYLLSNMIGVTTEINDKYTVAINNANVDALIVDESGIERNTFSKGETFAVKILAKSVNELPNLKLTVTAAKDIGRAYKYVPAKASDASEYQSIVTEFEDEDFFLNANITVNSDYRNMVIIDENSFPSNQELLVKNSSGQEVERIVTDGNVHVLTNLKNGEYTVESVNQETKENSKYKINIKDNVVSHISSVNLTNDSSSLDMTYIVIAVIGFVGIIAIIIYILKSKNSFND